MYAFIYAFVCVPSSPEPPRKKVEAAPLPPRKANHTALFAALLALAAVGVFSPFARLYVLAVGFIWGVVNVAVNWARLQLPFHAGVAFRGQAPLYGGFGLLAVLSGLALMAALSQV